ncbi:YezD family protein [Methylobacillus flagellatus]|uniref:YezD family protein n=1 Tax=Methylobacillus flagellatus TaxID=405 RepID=UPI0010F7392A|nr:YezD family protein [Methylobacillus flagellatus]
MANPAAASASALGAEVAQEILRAVEQLRLHSGYGSVEITVHDGRVTQIERREKVRFSQDQQFKKTTALSQSPLPTS